MKSWIFAYSSCIYLVLKPRIVYIIYSNIYTIKINYGEAPIPARQGLNIFYRVGEAREED